MLTTLLLASVTKSQCPLTTTPLGPDRRLYAAPVAGLKATPANGVAPPVIALTNVLVLALKTSTLRLERSATYKSWVSASSQLISQPWRGLRLVGTAMVPRSVIAPPFRPGSPARAAPADSAPAHSTPASTHGSVDRGSNLVAACIVIALSPLEQAASLDRHIPRPRALLSSRSGVTTRPLTPTRFPRADSSRLARLRSVQTKRTRGLGSGYLRRRRSEGRVCSTTRVGGRRRGSRLARRQRR